MYGSEGIALGRMKQKLERYKKIVRKLLNREKLTAEENELLQKDGVLIPAI